MRWTLLCVAVAASAAGCDRRPEHVKAIAQARLPALRAYVSDAQRACTGAGPAYKPTEWGSYATDPEVLNVRITCKSVSGLNMAVNHDPMRPAPAGDKSSAMYLVGVSKKGDAFPTEVVHEPSWLTKEPAIDLCVASGHPDAPDYTQVCVAFRVVHK